MPPTFYEELYPNHLLYQTLTGLYTPPALRSD